MRFLAFVLMMLAVTVPAAAQMREDQRQAMEAYRAAFSSCVDVNSCASFLVRPRATVWLTDEQKLYLIEVFRNGGDAARWQIVETFRNNSNYWSTLALEVGREIGGFNAAHISALRDIVNENPRSDATVFLGSIADEEMIDDLIALFPDEPRTSVLMDALALAGDNAIDPVLQRTVALLRVGQREEAEYLADIIPPSYARRDLNVDPISDSAFIRLATLANNPDLERDMRLAALLLLRGLGVDAGAAEPQLIALVRREEYELSELALDVLMRTGNADFVGEIVSRCSPHALGDERYFELIGPCPFNYFDSVGQAAMDAGPRLLELSYSEHTAFRTSIIGTLGRIGYRPAIPRLRELLHSEYWTEALEAAWALRNLNEIGARPDIESLSRSHWFPFLREEFSILLGVWDGATLPELGVDEWRSPRAVECESRQWTWNGQVIPFGGTDAISLETEAESFGDRHGLELPGGQLIGTDEGEWGGELVGRLNDGTSQRLFEDNVIAMRRVGEGAIIATGLSHLTTSDGQIIRAWVEDREWQAIHLTQLPEPAYGGLTRISENVFAAFGSPVRDDYGSRQFVAVFDVDLGVLGLAECVEN